MYRFSGACLIALSIMLAIPAQAGPLMDAVAHATGPAQTTTPGFPTRKIKRFKEEFTRQTGKEVKYMEGTGAVNIPTPFGFVTKYPFRVTDDSGKVYQAEYYEGTSGALMSDAPELAISSTYAEPSTVSAPGDRGAGAVLVR